MKLLKTQFVIVLAPLLVWLATATPIFANTVSYQVLKYHANETSMADSYYVRPARVTVTAGKYVITMTVKTANKLGKYPVTVNQINGQTPTNVTKTHRAGYYYYNYTFTATKAQLRHRINSAIYVSIPHVYSEHHKLSFLFSTNNLPAATAQTSTAAKHSSAVTTTTASKKTSRTPAAAKTASSTHSAAQSTSKTQATSTADSAVTSALVQQAKQQSQQASRRSSELAAKTLAANERISALNEANQKMYYYVVIGCVCCVVVTLAAVAFFVYRAVKAKEQ